MDDPNQQPIGRTIGRRRQAEGLPDARAREAWTQMAQYRTRAPKGIFFYKNHEEMSADRLKWTVDAMVEQAKGRG
jgi:hypothetical protein